MSNITDSPDYDEVDWRKPIPPNPVKIFISKNIWLPIIAFVLFVLVVGGIGYRLFVTRRKRSKRYHYWALEESGPTNKFELEGRVDTALQRDNALLSCSFYLRANKQYKLVDHLPEIGSRQDKQWFLLRTRKTHIQRLLTVIPCSDDMVLPLTQAAARDLREICQHIQHPYVLPVEDIAFQENLGHVIVVTPCSASGSLKDYIYSSCWNDHYDDKYLVMNRGLHISQVKTFGKQILQAMMYLRRHGLPWIGHVHTGNVILEDGVCKLSGYEGVLLGQTPRMRNQLQRSAQLENRLHDVFSFGHVMCEMLLGEELETCVPEPNYYRSLNNTLLVEFLSFIFTKHDGEYPSLKQISRHAFFQGVWLGEMAICPPRMTTIPPHLKAILKVIKRGKVKGRGRFNRGGMSRVSSQGSINSQTSSITSISYQGMAPPVSQNSASLLARIPGSDAYLTEPQSTSRQQSPSQRFTQQLKVHSAGTSGAQGAVAEKDGLSLRLLSTSSASQTQQSAGPEVSSPPINGDRSTLLQEIRRGFDLSNLTSYKKT